MLQVNFIRNNSEKIIEGLKKRQIDAKDSINKIIELDDKRKATQVARDEALSESKTISKSIGELMKAGKKEEANAIRNKTTELKQNIQSLENQYDNLEKELHEILVTIPNVPHPSVPAGANDTDNEVLNQVEKLPELSENALPHWEVAAKYDLIDFELGVKVTGAGFPVYKGKGARLQRAMVNFFLDQATKAGYTEIQPPFLVNEASGFGTGQLPDKEGQMYHVTEDNLYLIPTAEVPITNLFRDVIVKENDFPIKCTGYTPCFRREAGSYGKHVRGLNRLHQFDKVEIVQVQHPSKSYETLEEMREYVTNLLKMLELPFRTLRLCGGDLGFTSALTYDMEVFSAAQKRWLEVSSISNFESFQANRLKLRYKDEATGKNILAHTLNGSALAFPRILATILENNQTENGIIVPKVLVPYCGFDLI